MHQLRNLVKKVNSTHKGLGPMIAMNILAAKAKKAILNVAPAGTGKSVACDSVGQTLHERSTRYTSLTLAGLNRLQDEFSHYDGHIIVDDLGAEKSLWSRISTITALANLVYTHFVYKVTYNSTIEIQDFRGSVSMNIQPVLLNSLIQSDEWISVVRDKVLRYYHLFRPKMPRREWPEIDVKWGAALEEIELTGRGGKLWYQLVAIGLTQWSYARVLEHVPDLLRAAAALDGRNKVNSTDYSVLIKLLQPLQLERYIVTTYGFEQGRVLDNNLYCILVELASFKTPTILTIAEDYKVNPRTAERLIQTVPEWCWIKANSPKKVMPTDMAKEILDMCGVNQRW